MRVWIVPGSPGFGQRRTFSPATERPATPPLADFLDEVRSAFPPVIDSRILGPDIDRMAAQFSARVYP